MSGCGICEGYAAKYAPFSKHSYTIGKEKVKKGCNYQIQILYYYYFCWFWINKITPWASSRTQFCWIPLLSPLLPFQFQFQILAALLNGFLRIFSASLLSQPHPQVLSLCSLLAINLWLFNFDCSYDDLVMQQWRWRFLHHHRNIDDLFSITIEQIITMAIHDFLSWHCRYGC